MTAPPPNFRGRPGGGKKERQVNYHFPIASFYPILLLPLMLGEGIARGLSFLSEVM